MRHAGQSLTRQARNDTDTLRYPASLQQKGTHERRTGFRAAGWTDVAMSVWWILRLTLILPKARKRGQLETSSEPARWSDTFHRSEARGAGTFERDFGPVERAKADETRHSVASALSRSSHLRDESRESRTYSCRPVVPTSAAPRRHRATSARRARGRPQSAVDE